MKNRCIAIDYIRMIACLLVLVIHSPIAVHGVSGFVFATMTMIGSPCIGLFFMVSGYLLLPSEKPLFPFLKKRMGRVLMPTLFWTVFYLLLIYCAGNTFQEQSWTKTILSIPFTRQGCGFLWFMYAITGLYIITPLISYWVANAQKREMQFVLILWLITTCYSLLRPFIALTEGTFGMLYYFTGYAGYYLLGAYIKRFQPQLSFVSIAALYMVPMFLALYARLTQMDILIHSFGYLCFLTVLQTYALFIFVLKIAPMFQLSPLVAKAIISFSNCSFGIYLMHKFIMVDIIKNSAVFSSLNIPTQIAFAILSTALLAWAISYSLSLLPYSEYIISYNNRKKR